MKTKTAKFNGITLMELMISLVVIAMLVVISIPATRSFRDSLESTSVRGMINSIIASARAIAAKEQKYAGVRFQQDPNGFQYAIFILHDTSLSAYGFGAIEGLKPMKFPKTFAVMDLKLGNSQDSIDGRVTGRARVDGDA